MNCPHCGAEILEQTKGQITEYQVNKACRILNLDYTEHTKALILRFAKDCTDNSETSLLKFLSRIQKFPYDIVHNTISEFFGSQLDKKGYTTGYIVGMMRNKHARAKAQSSWLTPVPKSKN